MLRAEFIKARTAPTALALLLGGMATTALVTAGSVMSLPAQALARNILDQQFYFVGSIVFGAFALVLGTRSFTDEFRHGSIVPTFALSPRRGQVLLAKAVSSGTIALLLGVAAGVGMLGVAYSLAATKGVTPVFAGSDARGLVGLLIATALWAVIGAGVAAALRHQVAAIVGGVVWVLVVENVAPSFLGEAGRFLPGRAGHALAQATATPDLLPQVVGGLVLLAYAALASLIGFILLRRDVTAAG